jgi:transcriptional regulator with XRE-family HTH domain
VDQVLYPEFGTLVRRLRLKLGLQVQETARQTGLSKTTIWLLERGRRQPRVGTLLVLAKVLGTTADALMQSLHPECSLAEGKEES